MQRSIFQSGPNIQFTAIMHKLGYTRSPQLVQHIDKIACRVGGSQLVEDGIRRQRRDEERAQSNVMSPDRAYATLINKNMLGGVHRYHEAALLCCLVLLLVVVLFDFACFGLVQNEMIHSSIIAH